MEMDEAAVVARVKAGEKEAFRLLVERYSRDIFQLAYRIMGNEHDAEEVVQDTFLRCYRSLSSFESRSSFRTWIYRIATNRCYDRLRQRKLEPQPFPDDLESGDSVIDLVPSENPGPERHLLSKEIGERLRRVVGQLSASERTAFVLRHFEGRSLEEIASVLDITVNSAKNTVYRAVQKLRSELQPLRAAR
jgi:RNA polymerase sigma-70 factor, ECF subfamily